MKKLLMVAFIAVLGVALVVPAYAVENVFGGYFRTRMFTNLDFNGVDDGESDISVIDSRTRLYYTAVLNDNLKLVNKFEMDADWGDGGTEYGDIGADGVAVEVKNSYADFNVGALNVKMGTHGLTLHRGFVFADDFSGVTLTSGATAFVFAKFDETYNEDQNPIPVISNVAGANNGYDTQAFSVLHTLDMDTLKITPNATYVDGANGDYFYFLGADLDVMLGDAASLWATLVYEGGNIEAGDLDVSAFLAAVGGSFSLSDVMSLRGQIFYASGDDDPTDQDVETFGAIANAGNSSAAQAGAQLPGRSYYWAEIMGYGTFDDQVSNNSPDDAIFNITAANFGLTFKASDKLTLDFDLWYAMLNEEYVADYDDLGTEVDIKATYELVEGMKVQLVGAYLIAGDGTTNNAPNEEDPFEFGAQFSLSF